MNFSPGREEGKVWASRRGIRGYKAGRADSTAFLEDEATFPGFLKLLSIFPFIHSSFRRQYHPAEKGQNLPTREATSTTIIDNSACWALHSDSKADGDLASLDQTATPAPSAGLVSISSWSLPAVWPAPALASACADVSGGFAQRLGMHYCHVQSAMEHSAPCGTLPSLVLVDPSACLLPKAQKAPYEVARAPVRRIPVWSTTALGPRPCRLHPLSSPCRFFSSPVGRENPLSAARVTMRFRRPHTKSRQGCDACKARHIKVRAYSHGLD